MPITLDDLKAQQTAFDRSGTRREARPTHQLAANGKTCGTCKHAAKISYSKTFYKCALNREHWTHGSKTDIRLKDPACVKYEGS